MPVIPVPKGATSQLVELFIQDSDKIDGNGLAGLLFNSAGLIARYYRRGAGASVAITLVTMTLGTWVSGGFVAIDGTNMPGWYQLGLPDAAVADGTAAEVALHLQGAVNMVPLPVQIPLIAEDNQGYSGLKRNRAFSNFHFVMLDSTNHQPVAGKIVTVAYLVDSGAWVTTGISNIADELNGLYRFDGTAPVVNGIFTSFRMTADGCDPTLITVITVP